MSDSDENSEIKKEEVKYKAKLLLVDDTPANLMALSAVLDNPDYKCVFANSGREALSILLKDQDFSIILLDVQMPDMDGFETARMIQEYEKTRNIPIIFITAAYTSLNNILQGYELNAVDYILKPFNAQILKKKVSILVELYRRTQQTIKELNELKRMAMPSSDIISKEIKDISLQQSQKSSFLELVKAYEEILSLAVNEQIYKRVNKHTVLLKDFITKLCSLSAAPKDIIDIHLTAVDGMQSKHDSIPKNAYIEEGRMLLLETMGELASSYRQLHISSSQ